MKKHTLGASCISVFLTIASGELIAASISWNNPGRKVEASFVVSGLTRDVASETDRGTDAWSSTASVDPTGVWKADSNIDSSALTGNGFTINGGIGLVGEGDSCSHNSCPSSTKARSELLSSFSLTDSTTLRLSTTWDISEKNSGVANYTFQIKQFTTILTEGIIDTSGKSGTENGTLTLNPGNYNIILKMTGNATGAIGGGGDSVIAGNYEATLSTVPIPAAVWLFGTGLLGLIGIARRKSA